MSDREIMNAKKGLQGGSLHGTYSYVGANGVSSNSQSQLTPRFRKKINMFDFDGVTREGNHPGEYDVVITGRTIEEAHVVYEYFNQHNLPLVPIYFNPIHLKDRQRATCDRSVSGNHKARIIQMLKDNDVNIGDFHEDDPIQADIIKKEHPDVNVIKYPYDYERTQ